MHLPGPLRAAVGLAATAATEAKHLPDRAIELPMLVVSSALQASLRAQQRYARLAARGDEVLNRRAPTEEPPPWATFDEPVPLDELRRSVEGGAGDGPSGHSTFEHLFGVEDPTLDPHGREPVDEILPPDEPPVPPVAKASADKATVAAKSPVTKSPPTKSPAPRKSAAKKAVKKAVQKPAAKRATKKPTTQPMPAVAAEGFADPAVERAKTVSKPRHTAPSAFDNVADD